MKYASANHLPVLAVYPCTRHLLLAIAAAVVGGSTAAAPTPVPTATPAPSMLRASYGSGICGSNLRTGPSWQGEVWEPLCVTDTDVNSDGNVDVKRKELLVCP